MKVTLISSTQDALEILLYTKNTRLKGAQSLQDIIDWPLEKKLEHFDYMTKTIKSSFEFVDYTFEIQGVDRAFTHQLVRTRTGSYAQESQRTIDAHNHPVLGPDEPEFLHAAEVSKEAYNQMVSNGVPIGDARNILPIGITTGIIAKFNLRTLHDMAKTRLCTRTQGLYQDVFKAMKAEVVKVHPWAEQFINVACIDSGICCFPNYKECPVQEVTAFITDDRKDIIREVWADTNHVANPIAKDGVTM